MLTESPCDPLHRRLQRLRYLHQLRWLPGGTNQLPGGTSTLCAPAPFHGAPDLASYRWRKHFNASFRPRRHLRCVSLQGSDAENGSWMEIPMTAIAETDDDAR